MATFDDHIKRAKDNLDFFEDLNANYEKNQAWKATVIYYASLHLIHAFIADKLNAHPTSHRGLKTYIAPTSAWTTTRLPEDVASEYSLLEMLSRRARYMCHEGLSNPEQGFQTEDAHLTKAIRYLDQVLVFINEQYGLDFETLSIRSSDLRGTKDLKYFAFTSPELPATGDATGELQEEKDL